MEEKLISFAELQRDKRESRAEDARRLALGLVTPKELQEENSLIPMGTEFTILDLRETLERYYGQ